MSVLLALLVLFLSLVALALVGWRVFGRVKALGRTVVTASEQLAAAGAGLDAVTPRDEEPR